jgi:tetratricopeptide (TPR) repeat protein
MEGDVMFKRNVKQIVLGLICMYFILAPFFVMAQADKIFEQNNSAVILVQALDAKNNVLKFGSGFIVRSDGVIVTNFHVIDGAKYLRVKMGKDKFYPVNQIIYKDSSKDFAILKIEASASLPTVKLGDSEKIKQGQKIYLIGSPKGYENTISDGLVSGIRENYIVQYQGVSYKVNLKKVIQISAPMSGGSSGGAVFNEQGEVIGITTFSAIEGQNLNFAVPINVVRTRQDKLLSLDEVLRLDGLLPAEEQFYRDGVSLRYKCNYKEAIELFKKAIAIKADYADAHFELAMAYKETGNNKKAVESFQFYIKLVPDNTAALYNIGLIYKEWETYDKAIEYLEKAVSLKYYFDEAYSDLAAVYIASKKYDKDIAAHKEAIGKNPDTFNAHYNLGLIYKKLAQYDKAIESLKEAVRIDQKSFEAYNHLGYSYFKSGKYDEAIKSLKDAVRLKDNFAEAHANLSLAYHKNDDGENALAEYKIVDKLNKKIADELFNLIGGK